MEIVRKDKYSCCRFEELKVGDVFIENADSNEFIQMRTEEVGEGYGDCYNAVSLKSGEMYWLDSHAEVKRVHAELIIRNIEEA